MGLFGSKKKTEEVQKDAAAAPVKAAKTAGKAKKVTSTKAKAPKVAKSEKAPKAASTADTKGAIVNENNRVILRPRITEKASLLAETQNVFIFEIADNATKLQVRNAVASVYGVTPTKVSIVRNSGKHMFYRGRMGETSGVKKAYVYLKKGDKIELV